LGGGVFRSTSGERPFRGKLKIEKEGRRGGDGIIDNTPKKKKKEGRRKGKLIVKEGKGGPRKSL